MHKMFCHGGIYQLRERILVLFVKMTQQLNVRVCLEIVVIQVYGVCVCVCVCMCKVNDIEISIQITVILYSGTHHHLHWDCYHHQDHPLHYLHLVLVGPLRGSNADTGMR